MGVPGGGYCKDTLTLRTSSLIAPPCQGQLEVQLLQILALRVRAQLPGRVLLVRLQAEGPVCGRRLVRNLPGPCPPSVP